MTKRRLYRFRWLAPTLTTPPSLAPSGGIGPLMPSPDATAGLIEADLFYACHPHKGVGGVRSGVFEGGCVLFWAHKMRRSNSIHPRVEQSVDYGNQWGVAHGSEYEMRKRPKLTDTLLIE